MALKGFSAWSHEQCVIKGHIIDAIKDENGRNVEWVNRTTGERYRLVNNIQLDFNNQEEIQDGA